MLLPARAAMNILIVAASAKLAEQVARGPLRVGGSYRPLVASRAHDSAPGLTVQRVFSKTSR
jgi:hypothetical protein